MAGSWLSESRIQYPWDRKISARTVQSQNLWFEICCTSLISCLTQDGTLLLTSTASPGVYLGIKVMIFSCLAG